MPRVTLASLQHPEGALPTPDAKGRTLTCAGAVTVINPEQALYYTSTPENNYRKVLSWVHEPFSFSLLVQSTPSSPYTAPSPLRAVS